MSEEKDISKGYKCDHCGSFVKEYTRSLNANMAVALLALYLHAEENKFIKVEEFILKNGYPRCGDFSYLRFYGFLEPMKEKRKDGSPRNGYYRLTAMGRLFCEGKVLAFEKFKILHNAFTGFVGEEITIRKALKERFDYDKLMRNNHIDSIVPAGDKIENKQSKKHSEYNGNNLFNY